MALLLRSLPCVTMPDKLATVPAPAPRHRGAFFAVALLAATGAAACVGGTLRQRAQVRTSVQPTRLAQARNQDADGNAYLLGTSSKPAVRPERTESWDEAEQTFDTVYGLVKQYYVDKLPPDRALTHGAIRSLLSSLNDPNCYFLDKTQMQMLTQEGQGRFGGIGAALFVRAQRNDGYTEHKIVVVSALPGSPAARAGLQTGDVITHVQGKWVLGYDPYLRANRLVQQVQARGDQASDNEAVLKEARAASQKARGGIKITDAMQVLRGDETTSARLKLPADTLALTVVRAGAASPLKLTIAPAVTDLNQTAPLTARVLGAGGQKAAYVRVPIFTEQTAAQFRRAWESIAPADRERGLVLDLRGNPGGDLDAALQISEQIAPGGSFGTQIIAGGKSKVLRPPTPSANPSARRPVAVLVDRGTANVAEALAASLVDKGVGTLVGGRTFGDALLQTAYELPDGSSFVLVTGRMQGPRTRWAGIGLAPIAVAQLSEDALLRRAVDVLRSDPQVAARP